MTTATDPNPTTVTDRTALVTALARALPGFSTTTIYKHVGPILHRDADGLTVGVSVGGWNQTGRIVFDLEWPLSEPGNVHSRQLFPSEWERKDFNGPTTRITVSETTPIDKMAKAILSRLLTDDAVALWHAMARRAADARAYAAKTKASIQRLAEATGATIREDMTDSGLLYTHIDGLYRVQVNGDKATMEVRGVSIETAIQIAKLLKEAK